MSSPPPESSPDHHAAAPARIDEATVRHVAKLSRLTLRDAEVAHFAEQLGQVLGHIAVINEVDTAGVEPLHHPLDTTNVFRDDIERPGLDPAAALRNAPAAEVGFFKVPKVLGEGSS
jgi:aspartyl-tRNA(Asn)/glutamyl-tRNA(Gln) amidotransferase subunit C